MGRETQGRGRQTVTLSGYGRCEKNCSVCVFASYSSHMFLNHQPAFLCQRLNSRGGAGVSQRINDFSQTERKRETCR